MKKSLNLIIRRSKDRNKKNLSFYPKDKNDLLSFIYIILKPIKYIMPSVFSKFGLEQYARFILIGGIGAFINLLILFSLTEFLNIYYLFSEVIAFFIAITHNYLVNKLWTFKEKFQDKSFQKYLQYIIISLLGLGVNLTVLFMLTECLSIWYIIAEIFATGVSSLVNFLGNKYWTFKKVENNEVITIF